MDRLDARFDKVTRAGHFGLAAMGLIMLLFFAAFLVLSPSLLVVVGTVLCGAGAAYALYRPTHLTYALRASDDGVEAVPFIGRPTRIAWTDVVEVQQWWAEQRILRTQHLRLVSRRRAAVTVPSRIFDAPDTDFEAFVGMVEARAPHAKRTEPSRLLRFLIG